MSQRVFVDANIFVSRTIMDWLFHLRQRNEGMFQIHSTEDVFVEALHATRERHPRADGCLARERLAKIRACVDEVLPTFSGEEVFTGADKNDYHVHAGALASRADIILTDDDPAGITSTPDSEPYEIYSADDFFMLVTQSNPQALIDCTRSQYAYWSTRGDGQLDERLIAAGCTLFAVQVREALRTIARTG